MIIDGAGNVVRQDLPSSEFKGTLYAHWKAWDGLKVNGFIIMATDGRNLLGDKVKGAAYDQNNHLLKLSTADSFTISGKYNTGCPLRIEVSANANVTLEDVEMICADRANVISFTSGATDATLTLKHVNTVYATDGNAAIGIASGAKLTLDGSGELVGGKAENADGRCVWVHGSTFVMNGGTIRDYYASTAGGAVYVYNNGTFTMNGGAISGCTSADSGGALFNNGTAKIYGGTIVKNTAGAYGGFCYVNKNCHTYIYGGYFSGNTAGMCNLLHCHSWQTNGALYGGVFAADPILDSSQSSGVNCCLVLQDGAAVTKVGLNYVVGKGVEALSDGTLSAGTFTFNPTNEVYASGGLFLSRYRDVKDLGDSQGSFRYQVVEQTTGVTLNDGVTQNVDLAHGEGQGWSFSDNILYLKEAGSIEITGNNDGGVKLNQITVTGDAQVTLNGLTWTDSANTPLLFVPSGKSLGLNLTGDNTLCSQEGQPAVHVDENAKLDVTGTGALKQGNDGSGTGVLCKGEVTWKEAVLSGFRSDPSGGGVVVDGDGAFELQSGSIRDCHATNYGGGVFVSDRGLFSLTGGSVTNNTAGQYGGGVALDEGNFEMTGGALSGNVATNGGALAVGGEGQATISGGFIFGNVATDAGGSAIATAKNGTCVVKGGIWDFDPSNLLNSQPSYNAILMTWHTPDRWAVGDCLATNVTGFSAGTVYFNPTNSCYRDEGVRVGDGITVNVSVNVDNTTGWVFTENTDHKHCHCGLANCTEHGGDRTTWTPWLSETSLPDRPGHWYLTQDVTLSAEWAATNVALCLNGYTVTNLNGRVAKAASGKLIITDCASSPGTVSSANADGACVRVEPDASFTLARATLTGTDAGLGGAVFVEADGTFDMWSGAISGSSAKNGGGGVAAASGSTVTIWGGTISNCSAQYGGGIRSQGTVYIKGGEICSNNSKSNGNGIQLHDGYLEMTGGSIYGNSDKDSDRYGGGGIHLYGNVTATITGGSITNNSTAKDGGGIRFEGTSLTISGTAVVADNTAGNYGGGIAMYKGGATIEGGTISNNVAANYGGGGIAISGSSANCEILGGTICGNTSVKENGGAVDVWNGAKLKVAGGIFARNTGIGTIYVGHNAAMATVIGGVYEDNDSKGNVVMYPQSTAAHVKGGLFDTNDVGCVESGYAPQPVSYLTNETWFVIAVTNTVTCGTNGLMTGVFAFDPLAPIYAERGVALENGHTMKSDGDGTVSIGVSDHFHNVCCDGACADHEVHGWTPVGEMPDLPGFFYLTNDVALAETWQVRRDVLLCLNGHTVSYEGEPGKKACVVESGVCLAITDCATNGPGRVIGGIDVEAKGRFELFGVAGVCDLTATNAAIAIAGGGADGVRALPGTEVSVTGGAVTELTAADATVTIAGGGADGVRALPGTELTVTGGVVTELTAANATVTIAGGGAAGVRALPGTELTVTGGDVSDLTVTNAVLTIAGGGAAGVRALPGAEVSVTGGTVSNLVLSGATATLYGGVFYNLQPSTFNLQPSTSPTLIYGGMFDVLETNDFVRCADGFLPTNVVTRFDAARDELTVVVSNGTLRVEDGYLYAGTYAFNPRGEEYKAAGLEVPVDVTVAVDSSSDPALYTLLRSDTFIINGDFESGRHLPPVNGTNDLASAQINYWTTEAGEATVFGKDFADWQADLGVYSNSYALCLAPGAEVFQQIVVPRDGTYILNLRVSGQEGAVLGLSFGGVYASTAVVSQVKFGQVRYSVRLKAGEYVFKLENHSTLNPQPSTLNPLPLIAVDAITLFASEEDEDDERLQRRITNGGFEDGAPVPPEDGSLALAVGSTAAVDWTAVADGAGIYGRDAEDFREVGVSQGDYALYLEPGAAVAQDVQSSIIGASEIEIVSTGRWYEVSFDCARKPSSSSAASTVQLLLNGEAVANGYPPADGTWSTTRTLVFLPEGANVLAISNPDDSVGTVLVDNVVCETYLHLTGEYLYNNYFTYGSGLPDRRAYDSVPEAGHVTFANWDASGAVGAFGRSCVAKTQAGVLHGDHALFAEDGGVFSQTFKVYGAGDYRLSFAIAAQAPVRDSSYWPRVVVSIDGGAYVATNVATSATSYDVCAHRFHLEPGDHTVSFAVTAPARQGLAMDDVHLRIPDETLRQHDITGVVPHLRIIPDAEAVELVALGADIVYEDAPGDSFALEDFASDGGETSFFRLEPHARAYMHPTFRCEAPIRADNGFTIALAGSSGTNDGPIATCAIEDDATSSDAEKLAILSIENAAAGGALRLVGYGLGETGRMDVTNELATIVTTNLFARGTLATYILTWLDGTVTLYVNGIKFGQAASTLPETYAFDGLRLGAFPECVDSADLPSRTSPSFQVSDVRVYDCGLDDSQVRTLSCDMAHTPVMVTAYDPVTKEEYYSQIRKVGGLYGEIAADPPRRRGAQFVGWTLDEAGSGEKVTAVTRIACTTDHRLYANWSNLTYTVTYDFAGYPGAVNTSEQIQPGDSYAPPSGFEIVDVPFRGWKNALGATITSTSRFPSTGTYADETLTADYTPVWGTVTFDDNYDGASKAVVRICRLGKKLVTVAPASNTMSRTGYQFAGWWNAPVGGTQMTDETMLLTATGETWYAHWLGNESVSVWKCAGCEPSFYVSLSRTGEPLTLPDDGIVPVSTNADQIFYGWVIPDGFSETNDLLIARYDYRASAWEMTTNAVTPVGGARNLVARWWTACPFDLGGEKAVLTTERTYLYPGLGYDAWMNLPTPTCEGRSFAGWHRDAAEGERVFDSTPVTLPLATNLVATWSDKAVRVTLDPNGGTNLFGDVVVVHYSEPYGALPKPSYPGYALAAWHLGYAGGPVVTDETIVQDPEEHTLVATWTNAAYTVGYVVNEKPFGSAFVQFNGDPWPQLAVPSDKTIEDEFGTNVVFVGWRLGGTEEFVRAGDTAQLVSETNLVAYVEGVTCTIYLNPNGGALLEERRTINVSFGDPLSPLPVPTRKDCNFEGWYTADGEKVSDGTVWGRTGRTELYAKWIGNKLFAMTFDYAIHGQDPYVTNVVYLGAMPTGPAIPDREDAKFLGWWCGNVQVYDENNQPIGLETCPYQTATDLVAHWAVLCDFFVWAATLEDGVTNSVFGLAATDEPDEPDHDGEGVLRATHWYTFAAEAGTMVRIRFEDLSGADFPCVALAVYTGTELADLELVTNVVDCESFQTTLEFAVPTDATYYLAVAQGDGACDAALSAYEISATGVGDIPFKSQWTNPDKMSGATPQLRNAQALKYDGFSDDVAARVSPTNTYVQFTTWAGVGKEGEEIPPTAINTKPNVVLASAYNFYSSPSGEVRIVSCETMTNAAGTVSMMLRLKAVGDFTAGGASNIPLLEAAVGVIGSTTVGGTFSADDFDCKVRAVDCVANEVLLLVTPKAIGPAAPTRFFFKGVAY